MAMMQVEVSGQSTSSTSGGSSQTPLYVDLDGTLIRTDLLLESAFKLLKRNPLAFGKMLLWLFSGGKAILKANIARLVDIDASTLPYNQDVVEFLRIARAHGRRVVLATATNQKFAQAVADHIGLFDAVIASDDKVNRSGIIKLRAIVQDCGGGQFSYVANERVDLEIWRHAASAVVIGTNLTLARLAQSVTRLERSITSPGVSVRTLLRTIRVHQWVKNTLILVPLIPVANSLSASQWGLAFLGFICFGFCASSAYILNDLFDLDGDRAHIRKRYRPIPSGAISPQFAIVLGVTMVVTAFCMALLLLPPVFVAVLACYWCVTMIYSLTLKRKVVVDVLVLAGLYSMRLLAGAAVIRIIPSFWILAFSMFLFLSLASAKRAVELGQLQHLGRDRPIGRGYSLSDLPLVIAQGTASGQVAVLVLALYINEPNASHNFAQPFALWILCPLLLLWISRVWMKVSRGELHDDPVVFALTDRWSLITAGLCVVAVAMALWRP